MKRDLWPVTDKDVPPVNLPHYPDKCGWCSSRIGEEHEPGCVTRQRSIVARLTIEFVTTVPESFTADQLNFIHNGNFFCANNYLEELAQDEDGPCVCSSSGDTGFRYVREATEADEKALRWAYRWEEGT